VELLITDLISEKPLLKSRGFFLVFFSREGLGVEGVRDEPLTCDTLAGELDQKSLQY